MRFVILVIAAAGTGALSMGAIQTMFPQTAQTFAAMRALGGNPAQFKLSDLNPVKAYEDVMRKVTSRDFGASLNLGSSTPIKTGPIGDMAFKPSGFTIGDKWKGAFAAGVGARINQDYRRAQDINAYGRNPMAWHGVPPH
jgi:hypothetical protein